MHSACKQELYNSKYLALAIAIQLNLQQLLKFMWLASQPCIAIVATHINNEISIDLNLMMMTVIDDDDDDDGGGDDDGQLALR